jgi:hypothetical protein
MEREVIIRGHVFGYEEKAPFVASGCSVLGALEYDEDKGCVKCHECGEWFPCISWTHLKFKHKKTIRQYKERHGFNMGTALCTPMFSEMRKIGSSKLGPEQRAHRTAVLIEAGREHKRVHGTNKSNRGLQLERSNIIGRCHSQMLWRIQVMAAELGRTPTSREIAARGFDELLVLTRFGGYAKMFELAGLEKRPYGKRITDDYGKLPEGFPSKKQLLDARMPWSKEYVGVTPDVAVSRKAS